MEEMNFEIGQKFNGEYPPEAAEWCNANNAHIDETTKDGAKERTFEIVANEPPTMDEIKKVYENAVQAHLDATAQTRGYDNTYTCLSYLSSTDEKWKRESLAFSEWRDSVWRKAHEILNAYMAGEIAQPTVEEVIAQLPPVDWNDPE
jgi:hypothetical protein